MPALSPRYEVVLGSNTYKDIILADNPQGWWRLGDTGGAGTGYFQTVIADGASSYWRLNEASGIAFDSVGTNHGTVNGTVTRLQPGALSDGDPAMQFDGSTGWISAAPSNVFNFTSLSPFSLEAWVKIPSVPVSGNFSRIIAKGLTDANGRQGWVLYVCPADDRPGQVGVDRILNGAIDTVSSGTALTLNVWNHVVATYDGVTLSLYLNGVLASSMASSKALVATSAVVGMARRGDVAASFLTGSLDEPAIYSTALTAAQVSTHYGLRTASAAIAADSSGHGYNGTITGGVTMRQKAEQADGNTAALFDGATGYIQVGSVVALRPTTGASLEVWIKPTGATASRIVKPPMATYLVQPPVFTGSYTGNIGGVSDNAFNGYALTLEASVPRWHIAKGDAATALDLVSPIAIANDRWTHIVGTYDGANMSLYINGLLVAGPLAVPFLLGYGLITKFLIGQLEPLTTGRYFSGVLDEVAMYSYSLSATQIFEHYYAGAWTDITEDVVETGVKANWGITGNGPLDIIAGTGTCGFSLRNDTHDGKLLGQYSPGNENCRYGWTFGIPFRLRVPYNGVDYLRFRGKIRVIQPDSGLYGRRQVSVVAYDVMRDLAETDIRKIDIQINQDESAIISHILTALPPSSQPVTTEIDTGIDVFPYALDTLGPATKALSVIADTARSAFALVACRSDGTFIVRSRQTRTLATSRFEFNANFMDIIVPSDLGNVFNLVRVTIHPKTIDAAATTVLFTLTGSVPLISPGETTTIWGTYNDATNAQRLIGGIPRTAPLLVAGTDYIGNSLPDGTGLDLTANLNVAASVAFATTVMFVITNTGASPVNLTKLQVRGKGVYDRGPQTYEASSVQRYGTRSIDLDMPFQNNPFIAQSTATFIEALYNNLRRQVQELTFLAEDPDQTLLALTVEPSDRITVSEPVTGLLGVDAIVQSVEVTITERHFSCRLGLAIASSFTFWQWGITNKSEWGQTTQYAF